MSMSNHQKGHKLKASIQEFVGPLLKRLKQANEQDTKNLDMKEIIEDVVKIKSILDSREKWDRELVECFGKIEREIDYRTDHKDVMTEESIPEVIKDLKIILTQLEEGKQRANSPMVGTEPTKKVSDMPQKGKVSDVKESSNSSNQETAKVDTNPSESDLHQNSQVFEVGESSNRNNQQAEGFMEFLECMKSLNPQLRNCLYSLGIFPENTQLKKRLVVYWWIGLGLVPLWENRSRTAEQLGEIFFSDLVDKGVLKPVFRTHNQEVDQCTIKQTIHRQLIYACEKKELIKGKKNEEGTWHTYGGDGSNLKALLNLNHRYLNSKEIMDNKETQVVQLGRWCYTEPEVYNKVEERGSGETKSKDHIEVDETEFLEKMGEKVTYLSLRGISRIEELHESIGKLKNLMILDLRACHNLEKLPQKPSSKLKPKLIRWALTQESWFKKLTHLDISECYLLDHMPKWVCELSNLEVLKGFVVRSGGNKSQSCRLQDLSKLKKIRKLSIRIATSSLITEDFSGLKQLDSLLVLTITWGESGKAKANGENKEPEKSHEGTEGNKETAKAEATGGNKNPDATKSIDKKETYHFPNNLEKLDIRCYPEAQLTNLNQAAELKNLKRLYIRGGMLEEITNSTSWSVETLRLRFLKMLKTEWKDLERSFKNMKCVEYVGCTSLVNFPEAKDMIWRK